MQGNILGKANERSANLNIFTQVKEPTKKDGIWIKTKETKNNDVFYEKLADTPFDIYIPSTTTIGTDIYIYGIDRNNKQESRAYKYDTVTNTYMQILNTPKELGWIVDDIIAIGTDIYLFGSNTNNTCMIYKYETKTDVLTRLIELPYKIPSGDVVAIDNNIYIFGGEGTKNVYSYDIKTNTYRQLQDISYSYAPDNVVAIETDVYLFFSNEVVYKYDTVNETCEQVSSYVPSDFNYGSVVAVGTDIYLFGCGNDYVDSYKYDTVTNTYIKLTNVPIKLEHSSTVLIDNKIYLFYGTNAYKITTTLPQITKYKYNHIEIVNNIDIVNKSKGAYTQLQDIPCDFTNGSVVVVGTDIYILDGDAKKVYKYNTLTSTYTKLPDIPYSFYNGSAVAIGTNIYLFGGVNERGVYKYDTVTNTYTNLENTPYNFNNGRAVTVGNDIYLFSRSDSQTLIYKYNTLTNAYTQLPDIPYTFLDDSVIAIGTSIYVLQSTAYKYDTIMNTYTPLEGIPYISSDGSVAVIDENIFLFGGFNDTSVYKYNTITNTCTQLQDMPYAFSDGGAVAIGADIYLFGGDKSKTSAYKYQLKSLNNKTVVIENKALHAIKLNKVLQMYISNAVIYDNNELQKYPIYIGDGTQWKQISLGGN